MDMHAMPAAQVGNCDRCGAPLYAGDGFCTACGAPIPVKNPAQPVNIGAPQTFCTACGEPLVPGDMFCVKCGQRVASGGIVSPPEPTMAPVASGTVLASDVDVAPMPDVARGPLNGANANIPDLSSQPTGFCMNCGSPLYPGFAFCTQCATPVDKATTAAPGAVSAPNAPVEFGRVGGGTMMVDSAEAGDAHVGTAPATRSWEPVDGARVVSTVPDSYVDEDEDEGEDDDPTMLTQLVTITWEEAKEGCRKTLVLEDGREVIVDVPAGANPGTKVDIPGLGLYDSRTGGHGPLRVSFFILR